MDKKMLAEFTAKCKKGEKKLFELMKLYDLAELGYKLQDEQTKEVYNEILAKNEFFVARDDPHGKYAPGMRITSEDDSFMMSDEDFQRMLDLARPVMVERKITDENGYFLEDWFGMRQKAWRELVEYIIQEIVPDQMRDEFWARRTNVVFGDKLIDALKSSIKAA